MKRLFDIQQKLAVVKTEKGEHYLYRTLPQTLQALLPELAKVGLIMTLPCESEQRSNGTYIKASCILYDAKTGEEVAETSYETLDQNMMIKGGQGTGAAATYAKKGAIDGMFLLDAKNPDLLDLDDYEGLQKAAAKADDKLARDLDKKVSVVVELLNKAKTYDELAKIVAANRDVMNDERVKEAGGKAKIRLNIK